MLKRKTVPMNRFVLLLSIPIMALAAGTGAFAQSRSSEALEAFSAIVKARNAAEACGFLSSDEMDELKHYTALSEISATKASSVAEMQAVRDRVSSESPRCSSSEEQSVRAIMGEVRTAVASSGSGQAAAAAAPRAPAVTRAPETVVRQGFAAAPTPPAPVVVPPVQSSSIAPVNLRDPIARYGGQARAYFLERKCNYLDYDTELDFWQRLTARYKVMVTQHARRRINAAQMAGESEANGIACSSAARAAVLAGYNDLVAVSGR